MAITCTAVMAAIRIPSNGHDNNSESGPEKDSGGPVIAVVAARVAAVLPRMADQIMDFRNSSSTVAARKVGRTLQVRQRRLPAGNRAGQPHASPESKAQKKGKLEDSTSDPEGVAERRTETEVGTEALTDRMLQMETEFGKRLKCWRSLWRAP